MTLSKQVWPIAIKWKTKKYKEGKAEFKIRHQQGSKPSK